MTDEYDVHETAHLLQADYASVPAVSVIVDTPVRTEEMPTENTYGRRILSIGREPVRLLGDAPSRRRMILSFWNGASANQFLCVGHTQGQARGYSGMLLFSPNAITRYELWDRKGIWVCPGLATVTANRITLGPSTVESLVTWSVEHWSR
jgi:hypothetical protein